MVRASARVWVSQRQPGDELEYDDGLRSPTLAAIEERVAHLEETHPDVPIYTCAIDSHLNEHAYIVPGLGDAGDRIFGTK